MIKSKRRWDTFMCTAHLRETRNYIKALVKRLLGRPRSGWKVLTGFNCVSTEKGRDFVNVAMNN
jgi:hypothetical protein